MPKPVAAETGITCLNVRWFLGIMFSGSRLENSAGKERVSVEHITTSDKEMWQVMRSGLGARFLHASASGSI